MYPPYECPKCHSKRNKVVFSHKKKIAIWRRRECFNCQSRWTTYEIAENVLSDLEDKLEKMEKENG